MAEQQNENFVRQRRNLMISSLVLLFSEATELNVERLSVFGTELLIGQPQAVTMALWIAAIYWLIRYYQYSRAANNDALRYAVLQRVFNTCAPVALKRVLKEDPSLRTPINGIKNLPCVSHTRCDVIVNETNYLVVKLGLEIKAIDERSSVTQEVGDREVRIEGADYIWLRTRAWINLILHTPLFTEYVLPYIVFALPVIYAIYKVINGS